MRVGQRPTRPTFKRRVRNAGLITVVIGIMGAVNGPVVGAAANDALTDYQHSRPEYLEKMGSWETVELPEGFETRAIHAALLHTGDVLFVAGSGNKQQHFDEGTFETLLYSPSTGEVEKIATPEDLFCGGHAYLPNGNLLIAGGTRKYEVLEEDVERAGGALVFKNESDTEDVTLPKGTRVVAQGKRYTTKEEVVVPAAHKMADLQLMAGAADVWVDAEKKHDKSYEVTDGRRFVVEGMSKEDSADLYGTADNITLQKQNYQGLDASYEYDVASKQYIKTGDLQTARWYPTLVSLNGGNVLAVSGLDEHGDIIDGNNEVFERSRKEWFDVERLNRYFPTYPHLFRLKDGRLFYSGANTGYGSATEGRQPGIWNVQDNTWEDIGGLRDPEMNETASSFLLPPAQDQKVAIVGGGGVGFSQRSTARFDVVDLDGVDPKYTPAVDYPSPARYINAVTLPDDTVLLTNGSKGYRGMGGSDLRLSRIYDPATGELREAAPNQVGRNYHGTALLLPDGRVLTMGSDPLFGDADDEQPSDFETRIEVYTPAYLHKDVERPVVDEAPGVVSRGTTFDVEITSAKPITKARLMRPSAVTHQTDPEQRAVALDITLPAECKGEEHCCTDGCRVSLSLDELEGLTPSGWYMLTVMSADGVPSEGKWVRVE